MGEPLQVRLLQVFIDQQFPKLFITGLHDWQIPYPLIRLFLMITKINVT